MSSDRPAEGFKLLRQEEVPLLQATFYESEHLSTGAKHIHFSCEEQTYSFASIIPAVPADETGAPHILEHMVLSGGSKRYPDARSLAGLRLMGGGAWTGWEYTWYTYSGRYKEDFLKRIDSQLDFLFEPLLGKETFWHQAHHLEFEDPEDPSTPLRIRGVIFNEQKGIFSMPLYVTWTETGRALFPGLPYALEHGGTARTTPELTWKQLKDFHARHYHPRNGYFISWGDLALEEVQAPMDEALSRVPERPFERTEIPPPQAPREPRRHIAKIPIAAGEDPKDRGIVVMAWVTAPATDSYEFLLHDVIVDVLVGSPSAPLRHALATSGLGKSVAETFDQLGLRLRDLVFSTGLQDVDPSKADEVESLILRTLRDLVENGVDPQSIDAAANRQEFRRRLLQSSQGSEGSPTSLFIEFINTPWVNGGDPLRQVRLESDLARLDKERQSGRPIEDRIQRWLIDNPHRALVVLEADPGADVRMEEEERRHLENVKAGLGEDEKRQIVENTRRLRAYQEERAKLPELTKSEALPEPISVPQLEPVISELAGVRVEGFPVRTNGVTYLDLVADIGDLPDDLWDYLQIFALGLGRAGVPGKSPDDMGAFISSTTGGIGAEVLVPVDGTGDRHRRLLKFGGRSLERRQDELVECLAALLGEGEFQPRLVRGIVNSALSQAEQGVFTQATNYLRRLAGSHVRESWARRERISGFTHLSLLRRLSAAPDSDLEEVAAKLAAIREHVARRGSIDVFVAGSSEEAIERLSPGLEKALSSLPDGGTPAGHFDDRLSSDRLVNEARTFGMPAAFNCEVSAGIGQDHEDAVPALVACGLMARFVSIEVVRKGTAYHGSCDATSDTGSVVNWSVRDPHIARTYRVFAEAPDRLLKEPIDESELNLVLRAMSSLPEFSEEPLRRARRMFMDARAGLDPARFLRFQEALSGITVDEIREATEKHLSVRGAKATLASSEMIEAAKKDGLDFEVVSVV